MVLKAAFDRHVAGEEKLSFHEKMQKSYDRYKAKGYCFVVALLMQDGAEEYSVAAVSRETDPQRVVDDLDNFCWTMEHTRVLAVLDTRIAFEEQLKEAGLSAEAYLVRPALSLPDGAAALPDIKKLMIDKPRRSALRVIDGEKPEAAPF